MTAWEAITARRNVRDYRPDPIPGADLDRIAEAGRRAPSANNNQHWDFVVVTDGKRLQELSTVWPGATHIASAPAAFALILPRPENDLAARWDQFDLGQATMAMMIAATELGIGTAHSAVGNQGKARALLGVPDDHDVAYLMGLGFPADRSLAPIRKPNRRPLEDVMHREQW